MSAKTIAVNTISQLVGKSATALTTLIITLLLAQSLGANGYGDITKITTFIAIFYLFADFGLNAAYMQLASSEDESRPQLWNVLFTFRTVYSIVLVFLSISILVFLPGHGSDGYSEGVKLGVLLYAPTIILQSIITSVNATFQKNLTYQFATIAVSVGSVATLLLIFLSTRIFVPQAIVYAGILSMLIGTCVSAVVGLSFVKRSTKIAFVWDMKRMKLLFMTALPLGMMLLFDVIYFRADNILLTLFRTTAEVGTYGFAYKLFEFPLVLPTFFMNTVYPLMLGKTTGELDTKRIGSLFKKSVYTLLPLALVGTIVGWFAAPYIVMVRPEFVGSIQIFRILCFGLPVFFVSGATLWTLIALKKQGVLVWLYGFAMILNIVCNLLFIPQYGSTAAALVTVGSETFVLVVSLIFLLREIRL
jgi:O-antigen/teichoic acid export membrane protein